jgi:hypothetical protein
MYTIKFCCPKCHSTRGVEEIMGNVTMTSIITEVSDDGLFEYNDDVLYDDGRIERYQCVNCGYELQDGANNFITTPEEFLVYMKKNNYLGEK